MTDRRGYQVWMSMGGGGCSWSHNASTKSSSHFYQLHHFYMHNPTLLSLSPYLSYAAIPPPYPLSTFQLLPLLYHTYESQQKVLHIFHFSTLTILTQPFLSTDTSPSARLNLQACCTTSQFCQNPPSLLLTFHFHTTCFASLLN